jgi:hypothetical protein
MRRSGRGCPHWAALLQLGGWRSLRVVAGRLQLYREQFFGNFLFVIQEKLKILRSVAGSLTPRHICFACFCTLCTEVCRKNKFFTFTRSSMRKYSLSVACVADPDPDPVGSSPACRILIQTCYPDPYPFQSNVKLNYTGTTIPVLLS